MGTMEIKIRERFRTLIPPLSADEYRGLEESILAEGCRDALILWNDTLIDGHNRYEICTKHNLPFRTEQKEFKSESDAERWIILNQFARRNLSAYDRSVLALKLKPIIENQNREKMSAGGGSGDSGRLKTDAPTRTDTELGKIAGVGKDTIRKVEVIEKEAPPEVKQMVKSGDMSINKAFLTTKGITDKSPRQVQKEIIEKADAEREEFKNSKVVSFDDIKKDSENRGVLARNLYSRCLRMGTNISEVTIIEKETNISIEEMVKELSASEVDNLRRSIRWWVNALSQIERRL